MTGCEELIAAFTIFGKYTDTKWPTHCEHDVMQVGVEYDSVSDEDKKALEALGFIEDTEYQMFKSYKYGSA